MKPKITAVILLAALLICTFAFGFSGCSAAKYNVDYCGQKDHYKNAKDSYREGSKVVLYYDDIATEVAYQFFLDGEKIDVDFDNQKGLFIIKFTMPHHDVKLECKWNYCWYP